MFQYDDGEEVVLWMNTVGPYHNRQETYAYFSLPFCQGPKQTISHYHETLGEALQGVELEFSGLQMDYKCKYSRNPNNWHLNIAVNPKVSLFQGGWETKNVLFLFVNRPTLQLAWVILAHKKTIKDPKLTNF